MKKPVSLFLALSLLSGLPAVPAMADGFTAGQLSFLNLSEEDHDPLNITMQMPRIRLLFLHGQWVAEEGAPVTGNASFRDDDTLNCLLPGLQTGEVSKYLCSIHDGLMIREEYHPEKVRRRRNRRERDE